jgi:hypothetical protein
VITRGYKDPGSIPIDTFLNMLTTSLETFFQTFASNETDREHIPRFVKICIEGLGNIEGTTTEQVQLPNRNGVVLAKYSTVDYIENQTHPALTGLRKKTSSLLPVEKPRLLDPGKSTQRQLEAYYGKTSKG